jgi:hypothetical protein
MSTTRKPLYDLTQIKEKKAETTSAKYNVYDDVDLCMFPKAICGYRSIAGECEIEFSPSYFKCPGKQY